MKKERKVNDISKEYWPDKMNVTEFTKRLSNSIPFFVSNMKNVDLDKKRWAENWMDIFTRWLKTNITN